MPAVDDILAALTQKQRELRDAQQLVLDFLEGTRALYWEGMDSAMQQAWTVQVLEARQKAEALGLRRLRVDAEIQRHRQEGEA